MQIVGKEIVRFHTIIWPALLMALDLPLPDKVYGHGWILFSEDKMSKSKGNIVYPEPIIERYGIDALKYFLLKEFTFGQDGNYTNRNFLTRINSDLVNDLGNLLSRTVSMIEKYNDSIVPEPKVFDSVHAELKQVASSMPAKVDDAMNRMQFNEALEEIWKVVRRSNKYVDETMPWVLAKDETKKDELDTVLYNLAEALRLVTVMISPLLHITAKKIFDQLSAGEEIRTYESALSFGGLKPGTKVAKGEMLFPRLDIEKELEVMESMFKPKTQEPVKEEVETKEIIHKDEITIDDFAKMELRVGKVLEASKHPKADRLLVFKIQVGSEIRQIVSGIAKFYDPKDLIGRNVVIVANLKPVNLRGVESQGMILSAATDDDSKLVVIQAEGIEDGVEVR